MDLWERFGPMLQTNDPTGASGSPKPESPTSDTPSPSPPPSPPPSPAPDPEPDPERVTLRSVWEEVRTLRETLTAALSEESETPVLRTPASDASPAPAGSGDDSATPPASPENPSPNPPENPQDPTAPAPPIEPGRKPAMWEGRRGRT